MYKINSFTAYQVKRHECPFTQSTYFIIIDFLFKNVYDYNHYYYDICVSYVLQWNVFKTDRKNDIARTRFIERKNKQTLPIRSASEVWYRKRHRFTLLSSLYQIGVRALRRCIKFLDLLSKLNRNLHHKAAVEQKPFIVFRVTLFKRLSSSVLSDKPP